MKLASTSVPLAQTMRRTVEFPDYRALKAAAIPQRGKPAFFAILLQKYGTPELAIRALREASIESPIDSRLDLQVFLNVMGREEESFAVSNELIKIAPDDPRVLFNHGWHWLKRGELLKGMTYLENGRPLKTYGNDPIGTYMPIWNSKTGRGQRVILSLEGGFGDEIINFRSAQILREKYDCKVTVLGSPGLSPVFAKQVGIAGAGIREVAPGLLHESWIPGMSSFRILGLEYSDLTGLPYLRPDPQIAAAWAERLEKVVERPREPFARKSKLKVGIRWSGQPAFEHQQLRLFPAEMLIDLKGKGAQLFSFQRDNDLRELPPEIVDLGPELKSWDDTAAALAGMDLVISSCTSVAHMSAALGVETWVIVPALPYFCWAMPGNRSPWYQSVRLFRQTQFGDWDQVRQELHHRFFEYLNLRQS